MTVSLLILILFVVALLLFLLEVFVVPGVGISGVAATVCVVVADVLVYMEYGLHAAVGAFLVSTILIILFFWWFSKSKMLEKMALHDVIDSSNATAEQLSVKVGDQGVALTRLALIGNAKINGKVVEVKSSGEFISKGTLLEVVSVNEALIVVRPL